MKSNCSDGPDQALLGHTSLPDEEARLARAMLNFDADVARRAAQEARCSAERSRLAAYTRMRHRP